MAINRCCPCQRVTVGVGRSPPCVCSVHSLIVPPPLAIAGPVTPSRACSGAQTRITPPPPLCRAGKNAATMAQCGRPVSIAASRRLYGKRQRAEDNSEEAAAAAIGRCRVVRPPAPRSLSSGGGLGIGGGIWPSAVALHTVTAGGPAEAPCVPLGHGSRLRPAAVPRDAPPVHKHRPIPQQETPAAPPPTTMHNCIWAHGVVSGNTAIDADVHPDTCICTGCCR